MYRHLLNGTSDGMNFQKAYDMTGQGLIPMKKMITHRVTLDQLAWALDMTHNHLEECIKIVVYPRHGTVE